MKKGFMLSEVLIALAVIGIVTALTVPAIVKNYQKQEAVAKLKKAWSMISQAYNNSQAQNGMYQTWDSAIDITASEYFNRYWKPYLKVAKICNAYSDCGYESNLPWVYATGSSIDRAVVSPSARTTFLTPDGILYVIFAYTGDNSKNSDIYIDLNGSKKPNKLGHDLFMFLRTDKGIVPYCYNGRIRDINSICSKIGSGTCCAARLALDGWEIKDNYPW
jgi:prepilin-type N-terminal cleavage/methylation domain-containing protein